MRSSWIAAHVGEDPRRDDVCRSELGETAEEPRRVQEQTRREFLRWSLGGFVSLLAMKDLTALGWEGTGVGVEPAGHAEHCIVLFMNGGPSQLDTFDPKPGHKNAGPVRAIRTAVPEIQLSEYLPRLAEQTSHLAILRSMVTREGNHQRARYLMHTGYPPTNSITHPALGSIIAYEVGDPDFDLPHTISINAPSPSAGFLGVRYDPFVVKDPTQPIDDLGYPPQVDKRRFRARLELMASLSKQFVRSRSQVQVEGHDAIYEKASDLINSPRVKAFDLNDEPLALRQAYGMNTFGQGCLMARRLTEVGVRYVEVTLNGWDTHENNFERTEKLTSTLDAGFATLLRDLRERDRLDKTLVVWLGEFGRTPRINRREGRDHFPNGWSVALAGGGIRGGQVIGATDAGGEKVIGPSIAVPDLFASLCYAMGIDFTVVNQSDIGRPIQIVNDGNVIEELFAEG